jgi:hypothetical protein
MMTGARSTKDGASLFTEKRTGPAQEEYKLASGLQWPEVSRPVTNGMGHLKMRIAMNCIIRQTNRPPPI